MKKYLNFNSVKLSKNAQIMDIRTISPPAKAVKAAGKDAKILTAF